MELDDLSRIFALAKAHAVAELEIVYPRGRVRFRRADEGLAPPGAARSPVAPVPPVSIAPPGTPYDEALRLAALYDQGRLHLVRASAVGLFVPLEDGDQSMSAGARVSKGAPLGAIKALGVKHSVLAPVSGVVAVVYARSGDVLHYGHLIVGIEIGPADQRRPASK